MQGAPYYYGPAEEEVGPVPEEVSEYWSDLQVPLTPEEEEILDTIL
ncbi:hypothetical protein SEA_DIABLA_80 [Gordonia phage Diabla]|nr:hypothetical protein SEA_DIABLA_80 [Gordonia phage Diabla]